MIRSADSALEACAERDILTAIQTEQRAKASSSDPEHEAEHIGEDEDPGASAGSSEQETLDPADNRDGSLSGLPP